MYNIDELTKAHNYAIQRYVSKDYPGWFTIIIFLPLLRSFDKIWYVHFSMPWFIIIVIAGILLDILTPSLIWLKIKKITGFILAGLLLILIIYHWKYLDLSDRWILLSLCVLIVCVNSYRLWKMKDYIYEPVSKKGLDKKLLKEAINNIDALIDYSTDYHSHVDLVKYNLSDYKKFEGSILLEPDYAVSRNNRTNQITVIPKENIDITSSEFNGKKAIKLPLTDTVQQIYLKDDEYSKLLKWKTHGIKYH